MNIVIVGHVDHGKSSLIGRLLFDTESLPDTILEEAKRTGLAGGQIEFAHLVDSLEEERLQNITIDTTQTFFKSPKRRYAIIDAPGHKEFLRNMISGASRAQAAILVVDISRGIEEQTRRHASVLKLLGVSSVLVAINKMDLVNYEQSKFENARSEVIKFFEKLGLPLRSITPISAMQGDNVAKATANLSWCNSCTLVEELDQLEETRDESSFATRFVTQLIYPDDQDTTPLALGRLEAGKIKKGEELTILPEGSKSNITSIKLWPKERSEASAGESIALKLNSSSNIERGSILCSAPLPKVSDQLSVSLFSLSPEPISKSDKLFLKCATQSLPCSVERIIHKVNSSTLEPLGDDCQNLGESEVAEVLLRTETPMVHERFCDLPALGRFVLANHDGAILAAGIIN